jgi:hypothetical protein
VDDASARQRGANRVCTQVSDDNFTLFATTRSESRLNFLDLIRAGPPDYIVNDGSLDWMRDDGGAGSLLQRLAGHQQRRFADEIACRRQFK